jgi:hypothetical protein
MKEYENVKEFINDLIDNEGVRFYDAYGRDWMYCNYEFTHRDLGDIEWSDGLFCLHLYSSGISKQLNPKLDGEQK